MIITIASFKGGVAKTTTAVHLAAYLQDRSPTLLIDGDPNRSATGWSRRGQLPFKVVDERLVVLNDVHLRRLIRDYIAYYHADRIHDSLEKDAPTMRPVSYRPDPSARVVSFQRIGGLHHRYDWQQAA